MKKYNLFIFMAFLLFIFYTLTNIKETNNSTMNTLIMFSKTILPSLFPFLIMNQMLIKLGAIDLFSYFFQFISKPLFKISGRGASIIIIGLLNGFPSSAIFSSMMVLNGEIDEGEAQRLVNCVFFPSIGFLFAILSVNLNDNLLFACLVASLYLGGFICLYISSLKVKEEVKCISFSETISNINFKLNNFSFSESAREVINYSFNTLLNILGIIIMFSVPCNIIGNIIDNSFSCFFKGIIEFSAPSITLSLLTVNKKMIVTCLSAILSFSGLSSIMQATLFLNEAKLSVGQFILNRLLVCFLTVILLCLFLAFFL